MKGKLSLILFLATLPLAAQTTIPIQNPSFETSVGISSGGFEVGSVPSWTVVSGYIGVWQPTTGYLNSLPDGKQVLFMNSGSVTQDLGTAVQSNVTYTLTTYVGHRLDGNTATATVSLLIGSTVLCTLSVNSFTISAGTFAPETLSCQTSSSVPSGDLFVSLSTSGTQSIFDGLSLTSSPASSPGTVQYQATLTWSDIVNPGGTTYNVYRAQGGCPATSSLTLLTLLASNVASLGGTLLTYVDSTITNGQNYCYGVTSVFGGIESLPSLTVYVPQQPSNLVVH